MTKISMELFYDSLITMIDKLYETQQDNIKSAALIMAQSINNGGVVHVFGTGHSVGFGMEMVDQIGSLVPIHKIEINDFVLKKQVSLKRFMDKSDPFERMPNIADKLYNLYDIRPEDTFIFISNSGINGLIIDFAAMAKERGHKIIVVTSSQHTMSEPSRHPSGMKLYQYGDVVIDNCGPKGDALLETEKKEKVCSISSITGACIAQCIETETIAELKKINAELPILWGNRKSGYKEHNMELKKKYAGRI